MSRPLTTLALALALAVATPAGAQDTDVPGTPGGDVAEGFDLLGEGTRLILEGLIDQMRPMLEEARPYFEDEVMPFLNRMGELMDEIGNYALPERLPNGDILIRRLPDAPPAPPAPDAEGRGGPVEL